MAYSIGHKARTRQRILEAANRLFAAKGYEGTSIDEIMRACGLTRGGFYAHFSSKGQLYRDALVHGDSVDAVLGEYLGTAQPASATPSPAFAFLAVDLASKTPEVRAAFTDAFTSISEKLLCRSSVSANSAESRSLSTAALIVGALAVANTTDNPGLKAKLLASCRENAGALLGGHDRSKPIFFWEPMPT
jgi:TetR/AcrR family transcriptional repressor of nem operon